MLAGVVATNIGPAGESTLLPVANLHDDLALIEIEIRKRNRADEVSARRSPMEWTPPS